MVCRNATVIRRRSIDRWLTAAYRMIVEFISYFSKQYEWIRKKKREYLEFQESNSSYYWIQFCVGLSLDKVVLDLHWISLLKQLKYNMGWNKKKKPQYLCKIRFNSWSVLLNRTDRNQYKRVMPNYSEKLLLIVQRW